MIGALVLNWEATAAICVPIVAVCGMVVLCVRYIATAPDEPQAKAAARTAAKIVGRGPEARPSPVVPLHDDDPTQEHTFP